MNLDHVHTTLAGMRCVAAAPRSEHAPTTAIVLCHGYGAPGDDLVPLADELAQRLGDADVVGGLRFYFPEAPETAQGVGFGRAWWQLDIERLMSLQRGERGPAGARHEEVPEGLGKARRLLTGFVNEVARRHDLPLSRVILGGFSQGAMVAIDVALRLEEAPAGLFILSGTLLCASEWRKRAAARAALPVFQSHGKSDALLPFEDALVLRELLEDSGRTVDFHAFSGGHEIPRPVMNGLTQFLGKLL